MSTQKKTHGGKLAKPVIEPMLTTTVNSIPKKQRPVVTEDHPVVQKILAYIEKEIEPEPKTIVKRSIYHKYFGNLPENELVTYAIYKDIWLVPAIYEYDEKTGLSESDSNKLVNLMTR
jgi:hypothetical protein